MTVLIYIQTHELPKNYFKQAPDLSNPPPHLLLRQWPLLAPKKEVSLCLWRVAETYLLPQLHTSSSCPQIGSLYPSPGLETLKRVHFLNCFPFFSHVSPSNQGSVPELLSRRVSLAAASGSGSVWSGCRSDEPCRCLEGKAEG